MKGNFDAYVLWPLDKMVQNWIVDRSTARDFTVIGTEREVPSKDSFGNRWRPNQVSLSFFLAFDYIFDKPWQIEIDPL